MLPAAVRAAAVLSRLRPPRADRRPDAAAERVDSRERSQCPAARGDCSTTDPDVDHFSTYVGRGAIRFILTLNVQLANPFFAQFVIVAKDLDARERLQVKLEKALAEQFPDVVARVSPLELGPPVGWPLQYRVSGPGQGRGAPDCARPRRRRGLGRAHPARELRLDGTRAAGPDPRRPGRSPPAAASARAPWPRILNAAVTGSAVTQVRDDIYLVNVVARATEDQRTSFEHPDLDAGCPRPSGTDGAAQPVRDVRRGAGVPARLAARPRADADRARGRQPGRAARRRGR